MSAKYFLFIKDKCAGCQKYKNKRFENAVVLNADTPEGKAFAIYFDVKEVPTLVELDAKYKKEAEYKGEEIDRLLIPEEE